MEPAFTYPIPSWLALLLSAIAIGFAWFSAARFFPDSTLRRVLVIGIVELSSVMLVSIGYLLETAYAPAFLQSTGTIGDKAVRAASNLPEILKRRHVLSFIALGGVLPSSIAASLALVSNRRYRSILASGTGCVLVLLIVDSLAYLQASEMYWRGFLLSAASDILGGSVVGIVAGLAYHRTVRQAGQLEAFARGVIRTLVGTKRRIISSTLAIALVLSGCAAVHLLLRAPKKIRYSYGARELPHVSLRGRGGFNFGSEPFSFRSASMTIPPNASLQLTAYDHQGFLLLPRTIALEDSLFIDTASVKGPPHLTVPLSAFTSRRVTPVLERLGITVTERKLGRLDTLFLTSGNEWGTFTFSAVKPFYFRGDGTSYDMRANSDHLQLHVTDEDTVTFAASDAALEPVTFLITLDGLSLEDPPNATGLGQQTTLVFENCPEVEFQVKGARGFLGVRPARRLARLFGQALQRDSIPGITRLTASFRNANFYKVPGATLIVGAKRESIDFIHDFEGGASVSANRPRRSRPNFETRRRSLTQSVLVLGEECLEAPLFQRKLSHRRIEVLDHPSIGDGLSDIAE